jgi:surface protein
MAENDGNNRMINIINRRQNLYPEANIMEKKPASNQKYYYQSIYNIMNKNNLSNNNSMNKQNIRNNNNMINMNKMNINNNYRNRNFNNQNLKNINQISNNNINKALNVIRNEFKRKDDKIKALELKVTELENRINRITKANNFASNSTTPINRSSNLFNISQRNIGKNFTFSDKYSEEINPSYSKRDSNLNKITDGNFNRGNNPFRSRDDNTNLNNNYYMHTKSSNQYKIKTSNGNNGFIPLNKNVQTNETNEGSIFTGNSSSFQKHSKNEVKLYLKEVKSKVDPIIFKEFIQNIKLLTNSKDKNAVDRKSVIEMGGLFEECHLLTSINVNNFSTKRVTNMGRMFLNIT